MNFVRVLLGSTQKYVRFKGAVISVNFLSKQSFKVKTFCSMTEMEEIEPPTSVRGMKILDKAAFEKIINVSFLLVPRNKIKDVISVVKKFCLKVKNFKENDSTNDNEKRIFLKPNKINSWNNFDEITKEQLMRLNISERNFGKTSLKFGYDNWSADVLIKAILPINEPPLTSFSIIGHIIHLNIKDHLLEYKHVLAQILFDKISNIKTVIYKKGQIDNIYRNFEMEVLCGEPNFIASVKENYCSFELDFSKVYWNPRLGTEHSRIVDMLKEGDVLFDVFAGVGPFAIPAAKKKCRVYANDLNPESYKWLNHNIELNKRSKEYISTFNKDGGDFILVDAKQNLIKTWEDEHFIGKIYFVMNLPALSLTFLKFFKGLISQNDVDVEKVKKCLPIIHCYFFTKETDNLREIFEQSSDICLNEVEHTFFFVRKVSNSKIMHRITIHMPVNYLLSENLDKDLDNEEPLPKKICTE